MKENLKELQYYADDFHKRNVITQKTKGSSIRHKMSITASSIANYTRLIESLTVVQKSAVRDFDLDEISEESKGDGVRMTSNYEKKL